MRVSGFAPTCDPHPARLFVAAFGRSLRAALSQRERDSPPNCLRLLKTGRYDGPSRIKVSAQADGTFSVTNSRSGIYQELQRSLIVVRNSNLLSWVPG